MAPTPSPNPAKDYHPTTPLRTPQSKHRRLHFLGMKTPNPMSAARDNNKNSNNNDNSVPTEHPVEVIGRIRNNADRKDMPTSALEIAQDGRSVRVRTDIGYRDFSLDGVSVSEDEDLEGFYNKFVESRIHGVKLGAKCTIMMYGPTGSGKSHTMFGSAKQPGIVYRALRDILGEREEDKENKDGVVNDAGFGVELFVQITILEIYNEEIYDLLSGGGGGATLGLPKGNTPKVRLEVMGKKAKNASYITGNEAGKISREVAKVEKRRIVKSTLCNERSSRSHCLIILDVPSVGGRLMLVDMAGSENIEQAGQNGLEAKMQTAKINQGNIALKRVVESIAGGDSHVPFRDSKLTMLLQDSFEDDKSKILMILCASPDQKEMHKTISTLEYGAKAKCIVRVAHMPTPKDKTMSEESSSAILGSRIAAMNQFIFKLQTENKIKEKERNNAKKELMQKEEELMELRAKLKMLEGNHSLDKEEEINIKVDERTLALRVELEKMHEKMIWQQRELEILKQRLEKAESQRNRVDKHTFQEMVGSSRFVRRSSEILLEEDRRIDKSMDLDMDMGMNDQPTIHDVKELKEVSENANFETSFSVSDIISEEEECDSVAQVFPHKVCLSTVFEGNGEEEEEELRHIEDEEVEKVVVEESRVPCTPFQNLYSKDAENGQEHGTPDSAKGSSRSKRIQNIFRLCGNYRELAQQVKAHTPFKKTPEAQEKQSTPLMTSTKGRVCPLDLLPEFNEQKKLSYNGMASESPITALEVPFSALDLPVLPDDQKYIVPPSRGKHDFSDKENSRPGDDAEADGLIDVYVKWETTSRDFSGDLFKKIQVLKNASLADLRKLIDTHFIEKNIQQEFTFLLLRDPTGAPVVKNNEAEVLVSSLPICNNHLFGHLACLRPAKKNAPLSHDYTLLCPLENKLEVVTLSTPSTESLSPKFGHNVSYLSELRAQ